MSVDTDDSVTIAVRAAEMTAISVPSGKVSCKVINRQIFFIISSNNKRYYFWY